jgi:molybdopterin converting factor small subunit
MNVAVRYLAQLRQRAGCSAEQLALPGPCTVAEAVSELAARREPLRGVLLDAGGSVQPTILVFVGDEQVGRDHVVRAGDELTLMTPIAGGTQWQAAGR